MKARITSAIQPAKPTAEILRSRMAERSSWGRAGQGRHAMEPIPMSPPSNSKRVSELPARQTLPTMRNMRQPLSAVRRLVASACVIATVVAVGCAEFRTEHHAAAPDSGEWLTWGGDPGYSRYSPLDQITRSNVATLQIAWRWKGLPLNQRPDTNWKATPIFVDGVLYVPPGG